MVGVIPALLPMAVTWKAKGILIISATSGENLPSEKPFKDKPFTIVSTDTPTYKSFCIVSVATGLLILSKIDS